jgi:hypothetical protein
MLAKYSKSMISDLLNSWAKRRTGFFWLATSSLWTESSDFKGLSAFQEIKLDRPMRNSGKILQYAHQCLNEDASWNISDYNVDSSQYPQGIAPSFYRVEGTMKRNLSGYKAVFEKALLEMRDHVDFSKKVEKVNPFLDNIVVLIPSSFSKADVNELAKVATNLGFKSGRCFKKRADTNYEELVNENRVLFTDIVIFQGSEAKLMINFQTPIKDKYKTNLDVRMYRIDAVALSEPVAIKSLVF